MSSPRRGTCAAPGTSRPHGQSSRGPKSPEKQQGPDEEGHCSDDGRTAAGSGPCWLAATGTLYVVPEAVCTTAHWMCQALIHVRAKLPSAKIGMARKHKRSQLKKPQRGSSGASRAARPAGLPPVAPAQPGQAAQLGQPAQAAASSLPVQRPLPRRQPAGPLPSQDAAIPLERVPYFRSDLRRIAITAALMFVLLIVGSIALRGLLQA